MKQKQLVFSLIVALVISACGGEATPTLSADEIAQTAVAEAWIVVTQTAAAMPTATPVPPTNTPEPTATFAPTLAILPTLPPVTVAVLTTPTADVCNQVPVAEPQGALINVEFDNKSEGQVNLAFGMNTPNDKGECFTYSFGLGKGDVYAAKVVSGCYWGYAWVTGAVPSVARTGGTILCLTDTARTYHVVITAETITFK